MLILFIGAVNALRAAQTGQVNCAGQTQGTQSPPPPAAGGQGTIMFK